MAKGYATGSVSVGRMGEESKTYVKQKWNELLVMTEGTELEGMYKEFGEKGYSARGNPGGQFAHPEAGRIVKGILGSSPTLEQAVHQYYGHYSPGGGGFAGRYIIGAPTPMVTQAGASPQTIARARTVQAQLEQEHMAPAGQKGQSGWVQIPEQVTRVIATPAGVQVEGAVPTTQYIGSTQAVQAGGAQTLANMQGSK